MDQNEKRFFSKLGVEVRRLRMAKEMTLEDMQEHGFSSQHFQKIEAGKKAVNFYTVYRIAKAFNMNLADLVRKFS